MSIQQEVNIAFNEEAASGIFVMALESREIAGQARPGQFVMLRPGISMDPLLRRPFSICGTGNGAFQILYRIVGRGTEMMADARKGDRLSVVGPLGKGFQAFEAGRIPLLVGGGMGIAPLLFLQQELEINGKFLMGFAGAEKMVRLNPPESRIEVLVATDDGSAGFRGFVSDLAAEVIESYEAEQKAVQIFACGPKAMLGKMASLAKGRRIPCQVSLEAAMACGLGACQGCAAPAALGQSKAYVRVCRDGPVFSADSIDWERL